MSDVAVHTLTIDSLIQHRNEVLRLACEGPGVITYVNRPLYHYQLFGCTDQFGLVRALRDLRIYMLEGLPTMEVKAAFYALNLTNANPETTLSERMQFFLNSEEEKLKFYSEVDAFKLAGLGLKLAAFFFDPAQRAIETQRELDSISAG